MPMYYFFIIKYTYLNTLDEYFIFKHQIRLWYSILKVLLEKLLLFSI